MADKDSGDKTERPTPRRLRDARRKGDVAKSRDVGPAVTLVVFTVILVAGTGMALSMMAALFSTAIDAATTRSFADAGGVVGGAALRTLLVVSVLVLLPLALAGVLVEFLQVGPLVTGEKLKFALNKLDPVAGLKRMFGKDALVELIKNVAKAAAVVAVAWLVLRAALPEIAGIGVTIDPSPLGERAGVVAGKAGEMTAALTIRLLGWTCVVFLLIAAGDRLWSQHSYLKKLKMSMRDVRQEHKQDEGDPQMKASRRQLHGEWANQHAVGAVDGAAALLVNPTHLAIALNYDVKACPVPMIAARGQGPVADSMREAARARGVPIIRNVAVARRLWARGEVGEIIPEEMFEAIAEVILWAQKARAGNAPMTQDRGRHALASLGDA